MAIALTTAEKIALYRRRLGISQSELGRLVNESQGSVSYVETGVVIIDVERLKRYAIALRVEVGDLI
jgi:transcriptional regulator with XRE-family HTH domain